MKEPTLKLKYAVGLGDIIAWFLHSFAIGWITRLITGKKEPCNLCNKRRTLLNEAFPILVWKKFFKNKDEYLQSLKKDYEDAGYEISITDNGDSFSYFTSKRID